MDGYTTRRDATFIQKQCERKKVDIKVQLATDGHVPVKSETGDWYDLYSAQDVEYAPMQIRKFSLGVSMKLPDGYCAVVVPRSSLLLKKGFMMQTGVIDNAFCGPNDVWCAIGVGVTDGCIRKGERVAQFRLFKNCDLAFEESSLTDKNRGGFGSTGL